LKTLIIGFGSIGERHAAILSEINSGEINAVTKREIKELKTFKTIEEIVDINSYDLFVVSSETHLHYEILKKIDSVVRRKIIVVEKPLFDKYASFTSSNQNAIFCSYNLRFHPLIQALKNKISDETVISFDVSAGQFLPEWRPGRDYKTIYSADKNRGGGVLLDLSHEIDYGLWLCGKPNKFNSISFFSGNLEISSEDFFRSFGVMNSGAIFSISLDYISKIPHRKIIINTKTSTIIADLIKNEIVTKAEGSNEKTEYFEVERNCSYREMWKALIAGRAENWCTLKEALEVMNFIFQAKNKELLQTYKPL